MKSINTQQRNMMRVLIAGVLLVQTLGCGQSNTDTAASSYDSIPYATQHVISSDDSEAVIIEKAAKVLPRPNQSAWMRLEWIFFLHYGPNTFNGVEWGSGREEPSDFNPTAFDAEQWIRAIKEAGGKMIVLVCKHHDGLCLWPSRYTEHSVAASPWMDGKGDEVRAVADAARKYGIKLGVYLSPADLYQLKTNPKNPAGYYGNGSSDVLSTIPTDPASFKSNPIKGRTPAEGFGSYTYKVDDYNRYFLNQLYELLTEYGPIQEVWFDGANPDPSVKETYNYNAWYDLIRKLQPNAVIFGKGPDARWVGTESGYGRTTEWSVIPLPASPDKFRWPDMTARDLGSRAKLTPGSHLWWYPTETNVTILDNGQWFWAPGKKPRSVSQLVDIYYSSIGRNGNFIFNLSPDTRGLVPDDQLEALSRMSRVIKETFATNLADGATLTADSASAANRPSLALDGNLDTWWEAAPGRTDGVVTLTLPAAVTFDVVSLQEALDHRGQRIESFVIETSNGSEWTAVEPIASDELTTVGHKRLIRLKSPVTTSKIRIRITGSRLEPTLAELGLFKQPAVLPPAIADRDSKGMVTVDSPDGKIRVEIQADTTGQLTWSVYRRNIPVITPAPLGLTVDGHNLGQSAALGEPRRRTIKEQYPVWGNHALAVNHCNEAVIPVECADGMKYELEVRVFDDGTAVRTHVVLDDTSHTIAGEATSWSLPHDSLAWWARYDYERPCESGTFETIPGHTPLSPPITFKVDENLYVSLTEANNDSFPDMGLERDGDFLKAVFPASSKGWSQQGTIITPWRVAIIADGLNALVNSDIVTNLCPPPSAELANADWIKPGRSLWQWWAIGAPRMDDQKDWVDAAKKLGFEYYLIDDGWRNWRSPGKDQWQCLKEVIDYAKTQGVGSLVWVNSAEMRDAASRRAYLEKVAALGAVGIKIDFIPPCTPEITRWYEGTLKDTAELHLLCNFHGAVKPTGRRRTWPHELTREAVRGHEYHMTRYRRVQAADHDEIVLFTRFIAGPADYTPTAFDPHEMVGFTWAHLLAQAVDMTSPLLHFAGKYQDFIGDPAEDLLRHLPSTWDETIVLPGSKIGKTVGFARRNGQQWYIGVLNGGEAAETEIDLSFLGPGTWQAEIYGDDSDNPATFKRESKIVKTGDTLMASMSPRGGLVVWITKAIQ